MYKCGNSGYYTVSILECNQPHSPSPGAHSELRIVVVERDEEVNKAEKYGRKKIILSSLNLLSMCYSNGKDPLSQQHNWLQPPAFFFLSRN